MSAAVRLHAGAAQQNRHFSVHWYKRRFWPGNNLDGLFGGAGGGGLLLGQLGLVVQDLKARLSFGCKRTITIADNWCRLLQHVKAAHHDKLKVRRDFFCACSAMGDS